MSICALQRCHLLMWQPSSEGDAQNARFTFCRHDDHEFVNVIFVQVLMSSELPDNLTDQQLIAAINQGDFDAFECLYRRYRDWVLRLAWRLTGNHDDALDVLQETFAYVVRRFPGFRLTASMTTFLYPAVRNLSIAANRKRRRSQGGADELEVLQAREEPGSERDGLETLLSTLSTVHREILLMRFVDDMNLAEIAEALDVPQGTVKSRLHHAIQSVKQHPRLRQLLGDSDD